MSVNYIEKLDSETRDVITYLKSRPEISDLKIDEFSPITQSQINEWEIKNLCSMPVDLKTFYMQNNGLRIEWKFLGDGEQPIPLGKIQVNGLKELTRVSTALHKNVHDPSLFDLDDCQNGPKKNCEKLTAKSFSTFSSSSVISLGTEISNISLTQKKVIENENDKDMHINSENEENVLNESSSENENYSDDNDPLSNLVPHFGETSNNFELDNCNGYGKVCLVYKNRKSDHIQSVREQNIKEHTTEIWFLDRSLQWYYLTDTFQNYYRLLIAHLGLPQWQALFTEDGLPPFLYQWYYMLAPGRILIHDNNWQKLQFLTLFESNNNQINSNKSKNQAVKTVVPVAPNKIDFNKLFDDKLQKFVFLLNTVMPCLTIENTILITQKHRSSKNYAFYNYVTYR